MVTNSTRFSKARLQERPWRCESRALAAYAVISLPKQRGLIPVNGAVQDGSDALITPATNRPFHAPSRHRGREVSPGRPSLAEPHQGWDQSRCRAFRRLGNVNACQVRK
jgi:hypothetical protein